MTFAVRAAACSAAAGSILVMWNVVGLAQESRTVWDGVFTQEQAVLGERLYRDQCATCHGSELSGNTGPGLRGSQFARNWNNTSLDVLFDRIRDTMPEDNPGSLSRNQTARLLSFILLRGRFPEGATELPVESGALGMIRFLVEGPS